MTFVCLVEYCYGKELKSRPEGKFLKVLWNPSDREIYLEVQSVLVQDLVTGLLHAVNYCFVE